MKPNIIKGKRSGGNILATKWNKKTKKIYLNKATLENKKWYIEEISKVLNLEIEELPSYLVIDTINLCELDTILAAINSCDFITSLPKKDNKNPSREKNQFDNMQNKFATLCKKHGFNFKKFDFDSRPPKYQYYEDQLKDSKKSLFDILQIDCGTGINRAERLITILEEI